MEFESLMSFSEHLAAAAVLEVATLEKGMERCAVTVEKSAEDEIGHYQPQVGPFQDWAELADSTKEDRLRQGYTENDPLLRSGELRDSITHESSATEAIIGSTSEIMAYQEFGTSTIPPRPVIGPAAFKNKEKIKGIIGAAAISGMFSGKPIHESLGYDMEID
jgi:HK97 gp10 family phage protein